MSSLYALLVFLFRVTELYRVKLKIKENLTTG